MNLSHEWQALLTVEIGLALLVGASVLKLFRANPTNGRQRWAAVGVAGVTLLTGGALSAWASGMQGAWVVGIGGHLAAGIGAFLLLAPKTRGSSHEIQRSGDFATDGNPSRSVRPFCPRWAAAIGLSIGMLGAPLLAALASDEELKLIGLSLPFFTIFLSIALFAMVAYRGLAILAGVMVAVGVPSYCLVASLEEHEREKRWAAVVEEREAMEALQRLNAVESSEPHTRLQLAWSLIQEGAFDRYDESADLPGDSDTDSLRERLGRGMEPSGRWRARVAEGERVLMEFEFDGRGGFVLRTLDSARAPDDLSGEFRVTVASSVFRFEGGTCEFMRR